MQRQDVTVTFFEPVSSKALYELRSLPGVVKVEPLRSVPVRLRHGHRSRNLTILGVASIPTLNRIVDRSGTVVTPPPEGLLLSKTLAEILQVSPGERVRVEVLEGARPVREVAVAGLVTSSSACGSIWTETRCTACARRTLSELTCGSIPEIAALSGSNRRPPWRSGADDEALRGFEHTMAENMGT